MHAGKLGQVTNFTIVGGTASISTWFCFATVCYTAMPGGLPARLCCAFLVLCMLRSHWINAPNVGISEIMYVVVIGCTE